MKKSRIAKLALMGASITALAATLTTSTYAWYVSNKEANVVGGTGTTGTAGADDSILVSWEGTAGHFFKEINFADATGATKNALQPIHYTEATTEAITAVTYTAQEIATAKANVQAAIDAVVQETGETASAYAARKAAAEATAKAANPACDATTSNTKVAAFPASAAGFYGVGDAGARGASSTAYIKFDVYVYAAAGATVTPTITITTNYDSSDPENSQIAYTGIGLPNGKSSGQTFSIDPLKAIWVQEYVDNGDKNYYAPDTTATAGANAHDYYTSVTHDALWATSTADSAALPDITLDEDEDGDYSTKKKVTFVIYLDGADVDCFNSCAGYDIAFNVKFAKKN